MLLDIQPGMGNGREQQRVRCIRAFDGLKGHIPDLAHAEDI